MFWCSDPLAGKLDGYHNDRSPPERPRGTIPACPQLEGLAILFRVWSGVRNVGSLFSQVVTRRPNQLQRATFVACTLVLIFFSGQINAAEISDMTSRSGAQLKERFSQLSEKNPDLRVAVSYFKRQPDYDSLVEIAFRVDKAPEYSRLFFIPFIDEPAGQPKGELKRLVLLAQSPKGTRVLLGTISTETKQPEVKEENVAVDGKIEPGKGLLKNFFKCSVVTCVPAGLGCLYGGAAWLPCFCLWCGGGVVTCGATELLFP
jgi:hypothetical protein